MNTLSLAYSPCPNDTYIFHALSTRSVKIEGCSINTFFHDVETLNQLALKETYDVTKLSFHAMLYVKDKYSLLNSGAALSYGNGPLLIGKRNFKRDELKNCTVAVPGKFTTAHMLLQLFFPEIKNKIFTTYDNIFDCMANGTCELGLIIHESRFVYQMHGFHKIADLGQFWEDETKLPIPLGCIAVKNTFDAALISNINCAIQKSIEASNANPAAARQFIKEHSIEKDDSVLNKHISAFVNNFSMDMGQTGRKAYETLERLAAKAGII